MSLMKMSATWRNQFVLIQLGNLRKVFSFEVLIDTYYSVITYTQSMLYNKFRYMRTTNLIATIILSLFLIQTTYSQISIWEENFNYNNGTTTGQGDPAITSWTADGRQGPGGVDIRDDMLEGKNTRGPNPDRTTWQIDAGNPIGISGYNVDVSIDLSETGNMDAIDYIQVQYNLDNNGWNDFMTNGYINDDFDNATATNRPVREFPPLTDYYV